jgi:hypothetical protein
MSNQLLNPPLGASKALKIKNGLEMRKLWPPKVRGLIIQNNKPQIVLKHSETSFMFFFFFFFVIIVQRLFVDLKVRFL